MSMAIHQIPKPKRRLQENRVLEEVVPAPTIQPRWHPTNQEKMERETSEVLEEEEEKRLENYLLESTAQWQEVSNEAPRNLLIPKRREREWMRRDENHTYCGGASPNQPTSLAPNQPKK